MINSNSILVAENEIVYVLIHIFLIRMAGSALNRILPQGWGGAKLSYPMLFITHNLEVVCP